MTATDEKMAEPAKTDPCPRQCTPLSGRRAAGEDPVKREQIIDGAKRVFMSVGFDAASMNDITREAGVSKGTIYVYFENKEDLFGALIERERERVVQNIKHALDEKEPIDEAMFDFGVTLTQHLTGDHTIRAMRMVLGVIDRMPGLARRFFVATPESGYTILKAYLDRRMAQGDLVIADTEMAARQFIEMSLGGMLKRRLFGEMAMPPSRETIEELVSAALTVFLAAYGQKRKIP